MSTFALPSAAMPLERPRARTQASQRLAWCVLALLVLLEVAVQFFPKAMLLSPLQGSVLFKQVSGYSMVSLLAFAMLFGVLRRHPALVERQRPLAEIHQLGGLLLIVLLALHLGESPRGFLLFTFHALTVGVAAGALRGALGSWLGRRGATALLIVHISLNCLVSAGVLMHLYFVYSYTA